MIRAFSQLIAGFSVGVLSRQELKSVAVRRLLFLELRVKLQLDSRLTSL
jgi:hypothetical protein